MSGLLVLFPAFEVLEKLVLVFGVLARVHFGFGEAGLLIRNVVQIHALHERAILVSEVARAVFRRAQTAF